MSAAVIARAATVAAAGARTVWQGLSGANGLRTAGALAVGVGGTAVLVGKGAKEAASGAGDGLFKAGVGLAAAYLVFKALTAKK